LIRLRESGEVAIALILLAAMAVYVFGYWRGKVDMGDDRAVMSDMARSR